MLEALGVRSKDEAGVERVEARTVNSGKWSLVMVNGTQGPLSAGSSNRDHRGPQADCRPAHCSPDLRAENLQDSNHGIQEDTASDKGEERLIAGIGAPICDAGGFSLRDDGIACEKGGKDNHGQNESWREVAAHQSAAIQRQNDSRMEEDQNDNYSLTGESITAVSTSTFMKLCVRRVWRPSTW